MRFVIVDDSRIERAKLRGILERYGHEVIGEGANGQEGINLVDSLKPDAVILDVVMPKLSGDVAGFVVRERHPNIMMFFATKNNQKAIQRTQEFLKAALVVKPYEDAFVKSAIESQEREHGFGV